MKCKTCKDTRVFWLPAAAFDGSALPVDCPDCALPYMDDPPAINMVLDVCDCCGGSGVPAEDGAACSCGGTGTLSGQRDFLRKKVYELDSRLQERKLAEEYGAE